MPSRVTCLSRKPAALRAMKWARAAASVFSWHICWQGPELLTGFRALAIPLVPSSQFPDFCLCLYWQLATDNWELTRLNHAKSSIPVLDIMCS